MEGEKRCKDERQVVTRGSGVTNSDHIGWYFEVQTGHKKLQIHGAPVLKDLVEDLRME